MTSHEIDDLIAGLGQSRQVQSRNATASQILKRAWVMERSAPILQPYLGHVVEEVTMQIRELAATIEETSLALQDSGEQDKDVKMRLLIVETELERLKFTARSYLRARLAKIDRNLVFYGLNADATGLSPSERQYVDRHLGLLNHLYYSSFMHTWPEELHDLADTTGPVSMVDEPDMYKPVAVRVLRDVLSPVYVGNDVLDFKKGGVYILRYSAVADLLEDNGEGPVIELF